MKIVKPSVTLITEKDPFKRIEMAGRTCYKSEANITEDSAKKFFSGLVDRKHVAMVEHAAFAFQVYDEAYFRELYTVGRFLNFTNVDGRMIVSGNVRALNEAACVTHNLLCVLERSYHGLYYIEHNFGLTCNEAPRIVFEDELYTLTLQEQLAHIYTSFRFITDRGVTHEIVRHRPASYGHESTRYCNYGKSGEVTFILPSWIDYGEGEYTPVWDKCVGDHSIDPFSEGSPESWWFWACASAERTYLKLLDEGWLPQQARSVLPNSLKTEIIMTANGAEYNHFFNLRSLGLTGKPHPDMKVVADVAYDIYCREVINLAA